MRKTYDKLVRDRIPEIINREGRECGVEVMTDEDYRQALLEKVSEEAQEVSLAAQDDLMAEIADLYEVIDEVIAAFHLDREAILTVQKQRQLDRGGFEKRIKLLWTE